MYLHSKIIIKKVSIVHKAIETFKSFRIITSLPQIYPILITNDLHLYGTKMFPQFE